MNFIKKAITLIIAVSVIPIILAVISATAPNDTAAENYLEFEIVNISTNEVNIPNNTIANKINDPINIFTDLVVNANIVSNTLNTFILNDYQLVDTNGELPLGLPNDHLYFKFYDTGTTWLYAIDNDPYQIETGTITIPGEEWGVGVSTSLAGYTWVANGNLTAQNVIDFPSPKNVNFYSNNLTYYNNIYRGTQNFETALTYKNTNTNIDNVAWAANINNWISNDFKKIIFMHGADISNVELINWLLLYGTLRKSSSTIVPTYDTPQLVYDVTPLINAKIYSPTYETTFDLMDDNQIMGQIMEWYELSDFTIYQYTNNTDNVLQMYNNGTISFNNTYNNGDIIRINYQADTPIIIIPMWYTLLMLTPLIFIAGILAYLLTERENQGV